MKNFDLMKFIAFVRVAFLYLLSLYCLSGVIYFIEIDPQHPGYTLTYAVLFLIALWYASKAYKEWREPEDKITHYHQPVEYKEGDVVVITETLSTILSVGDKVKLEFQNGKEEWFGDICVNGKYSGWKRRWLGDSKFRLANPESNTFTKTDVKNRV